MDNRWIRSTYKNSYMKEEKEMLTPSSILRKTDTNRKIKIHKRPWQIEYQTLYLDLGRCRFGAFKSICYCAAVVLDKFPRFLLALP